MAVAKLEFRATGGVLNDAIVAIASLTPYGWFATWNTGAVANGGYSLTALASDAAGNTKRSAAVSITVAH